MDNKEVEKVLEELQEVRPEKLTGEAKRLFEAIMIIADSQDKVKADLYEANKRIADLLLILGDRDRMINLMAQAIDNYDSQLEINSYRDKDEIIEAFKEAMARRDFREKKRKEFEERCKNAKD